MPVKEMYFLIKIFLTKETSEPKSFQHILLSIYEEMIPHQELFRKRGLDSFHIPHSTYLSACVESDEHLIINLTKWDTSHSSCSRCILTAWGN